MEQIIGHSYLIRYGISSQQLTGKAASFAIPVSASSSSSVLWALWYSCSVASGMHLVLVNMVMIGVDRGCFCMWNLYLGAGGPADVTLALS